jgi:glycosyltransferase involved in cell wall biosynthesis
LEHVAREDVAALYTASDVFVFPSLYEGFGLPLLEAMVCGVPVVTGRFGSIPEVAGETCVYVDSQLPSSLASGIESVLAWDAAVRKERTEKAKCRAEGFTWELTARRTLEVLEAAAEPGGSGGPDMEKGEGK